MRRRPKEKPEHWSEERWKLYNTLLTLEGYDQVEAFNKARSVHPPEPLKEMQIVPLAGFKDEAEAKAVHKILLGRFAAGAEEGIYVEGSRIMHKCTDPDCVLPTDDLVKGIMDGAKRMYRLMLETSEVH